MVSNDFPKAFSDCHGHVAEYRFEVLGDYLKMVKSIGFASGNYR